jgi:hypothetical protein
VAIRYPAVGSIVSGNLTATTKATLADAWEADLVAAGWTSADIPASLTGTFTGQPADNQTITIDGTTFTAKNTPTTNFHFQIGASFAATATNMATQIAAYHPTFTATDNGAGVVTMTALTGGLSKNNATVTEGMSNFTVSGNAWNGGYRLTSAPTETRLQMAVYIYESDTTANLRVQIGSADWLSTKQTFAVTTGAGVIYKSVATAHTFWLWQYNATTGLIYAGTPFVREPQRGTLISGAADNGSGLVRITATAHGLTTGQTAYVEGVKIGGSYSAAVNGSRVVTVVDADTLDLQGTTWPGGTYDTDTGVVATVNQIARAIYCMQDGESWRTSDRSGGNTRISLVNEMAWTGGGNIRFIIPSDTSGNVFPNYGEIYDVFEPRIAWPASSGAADPLIIGDVFAAFCVSVATPMELTASFDGHDWVNFTNNATEQVALWLAVN